MIYLSSMINDISQHMTLFFMWISIFAASYILSGVPAILSSYFNSKARYIAFEKLVFFGNGLFNCNPQLLTDLGFQKKQSLYTNQIWTNVIITYGNLITLFSSIISCTIGIVVFLVSLSAIYIAGFATALLLVGIIVIATIKKRQFIAVTSQKNDASLMHMLYPGWTTNIIGNPSNSNNWKNDFRASLKSTYMFWSRASAFYSGLSALTTVVVFICCAGTDIYLIISQN
jgi:hypothetical protein